MPNEYQINPALNKDLVFSFQPPPVIDISKLPNLAKYWLDDLQKIICRTDDTLPKDILNAHLGETSHYIAKKILSNQLQLIYHRLQGNLDSELGKLSTDDWQAIIIKLSEEIIHCSEGLHNRVNLIVDAFHKPRNLAELLCVVRKNLVKKVAQKLSTEVHAQNHVEVIAASDGLGIKVNFPEDRYIGALTDISIRRALQQEFHKKFTPFHLPCLLITAFVELIPEFEIEKNHKNGLTAQTIEKITGLIKCFLPAYINKDSNNPNYWENYFKKNSVEKNSTFFSIVDINFEKLYESFFYTLSDQNYLINPQINTLLDCAYYNLFLRKETSRNPAKLIARLLKAERYAELLEQLLELNARYPNYYGKECKIKITAQYCLPFIEYLKQQLQLSHEYSQPIMLGFSLVIRFNLSKNKYIIEQIADSFLVKNKAGFNLLMLGALNQPTLVNDILDFLKTHKTIIRAEKIDLAEKMFLMKNSDNCNALMIAANKQADAIVTILGFLKNFANDTLYKLFTQQQKKDSNTAVTLTARAHPDRLSYIFSFITDYIKFDGETLRKLLFPGNSKVGCTTLMLAIKSQTDATSSILNFISKNIKNFDSEILREMFFEKDENGFTALMLAARYQPESLKDILTFLDKYPAIFSQDYLVELFLEKNSENYNCLMLAAEYQPISVPTLLNFISSPKNFKTVPIQLLFVKNKKGCNALMLSRHHPEAMMFIINFIYTQPKDVTSLTLEEIFLEKHKLGLTFLMLLARDKTQSLKDIFEFIKIHPNLFSKKNLLKLFLEKNDFNYNILMFAARNQPDAVDAIIGFIKNHSEFSLTDFIIQFLLTCDIDNTSLLMIATRYQPAALHSILGFIHELANQHKSELFDEFINTLFLVQDKFKVNALMTAAIYQIPMVERLLIFLMNHIEYFSRESIYEFAFTKIYDKTAGFVYDRYDIQKSVFSIAAKHENPIAITALLKFIEGHIDKLGIESFASFLTEKDNRKNYIFQTVCTENFFIMKNVLNFIATSLNDDFITTLVTLTGLELNIIQKNITNFVYAQLAQWPIKTEKDKTLFYNITTQCSPFLIKEFSIEQFKIYSENMNIIAKIQLRYLLQELEIKNAQEQEQPWYSRLITKLMSTTAQELAAARNLEKIVFKKIHNKKSDLDQLKSQHTEFQKPKLILSCLFVAFKETEVPKADEAYEADREKTNWHFKVASPAFI